MHQQGKTLLEKLGYQNILQNRTLLFNDLIKEVEECIDYCSYEEIKKLINNKKSYLYVELKMFYEIGLNDIQKELISVHNSRNLENVDIETYEEVYRGNINPTFAESVIAIADYRRKKRNEIMNSSKNIIKKRDSLTKKIMVKSKI